MSKTTALWLMCQDLLAELSYAESSDAYISIAGRITLPRLMLLWQRSTYPHDRERWVK
jgi:hypothetical protein